MAITSPRCGRCGFPATCKSNKRNLTCDSCYSRDFVRSHPRGIGGPWRYDFATSLNWIQRIVFYFVYCANVQENLRVSIRRAHYRFDVWINSPRRRRRLVPLGDIIDKIDRGEL